MRHEAHVPERQGDARLTAGALVSYLWVALLGIAALVPWIAVLWLAADPEIAFALISNAFAVPEHEEAAAYLSGLVGLPIFFLIALRMRFWRVLRQLAEHPMALCATSVVAAVVIVFMLRHTPHTGPWYYVRHNVLLGTHGWGWLAVGAAACALAFMRGPARLRSVGAAALGLALLGILVATSLFERHDPIVAAASGHFEAMFFPVASTFLGAPMLSESGTQYGLYPLFLAPVFHVVGLTVESYSVVMTTLAVVCQLLLLYVALRTIRWRALAFGVWAAQLVGCSLYNRLATWLEARDSDATAVMDPYYQYLPLRVLFPALVLALLVRRSAHPVRWRIFAMVCASLGVFWNMESGIIAWFACLLAYGYDGVAPERGLQANARALVGTVLSGSACLVAAFLVVSIAYRAAFGLWPAWNHWWDFQQYYYLHGYFALPLPAFHAWQIVVLVYLVGLARAIDLWLHTPAAARVGRPYFLLSAMGLGLFTYYQGRSHDLNLLPVSCPAWFVVGMLLDELRAAQSARALRTCALCVVFSWLVTGLALGWRAVPQVRDRLALWRGTEATALYDRDLEFMAAQKGIVLSPIASVYYLAGARRPLFSPSLPELIGRDDFERLYARLRDKDIEEIIIDTPFLRHTRNDPVWREVLSGGALSVDLVRTSPSGVLRVLARRKP